MASNATRVEAKVTADFPAVTDELRKAEIVRLLIEAGDGAREIIATTLRDNGAPSSAADMMWALATSDAAMTLRDTAAKLGRDPSTVTLAADKLEAAGIVARRPHPTDGRKRALSLTDEGADLWEAVRRNLHASRMLADLSTEEQLTLLELLRRIR
jgi:DNA-binding MarR family transcriptional regulator